VKAPAVPSLYASASLARSAGEVILKVVNVSAAELPTAIRLAGATRIQAPAKAIVLSSASPLDENTLDHPTKVAPVARTLDLRAPDFQHVFPPNSVTVLRVKCN
jgi:alpha-L-arabinofuranosidase